MATIQRIKAITPELATRIKSYFLPFPKYTKNWGVFDLEVVGRKVICWFIILSDGTYKCGFGGAGEFMRWIKENLLKTEKNKQKSWSLYAHNGSKYDLTFLLPYMVNEGGAGKNSTQITQYKYYNIYFLDSRLIFRQSLSDLTLTKEEEEIKRKGVFFIKRDNLAELPKPELVKYCANDCLIVLRLLNEHFIRGGKDLEKKGIEDGYNKLVGKVSVGSTAFYKFRKMHPEVMKHFPNLAKPWYSKIYDFIQPSLFGGFSGMGNQAIYRGWSVKADMNSIYPHVMKTEDMPILLPEKHYTDEEPVHKVCKVKTKKYEEYTLEGCDCRAKHHLKPALLNDLINKDPNNIPFGFFCVKFWGLKAKTYDSQKIPFVVVKREDGTTFCPQNIEYLEKTLFGEYLKFILEYYSYDKMVIEEAYTFENKKGLFDAWIDECQIGKQQAKEDKNRAHSRRERIDAEFRYSHYKLNQTTLYGKMGQKKLLREGIWIEITPYDNEKGLHEKHVFTPRTNAFDDKLFSPATYTKKEGNKVRRFFLATKEEKDGFGFNYCPVACAITSYAKITLIKKIYEIGVDNVLYYDTDSITSKVPFPDDCIHPSKIGFWKIEAILSEFIVFASKSYWMRYKERIKGQQEREWVYKGFPKHVLIKVDPVKAFHNGEDVPVSNGYRQNWGTEILTIYEELKPAKENPKMKLEEKEGEYFWRPFANEKEGFLHCLKPSQETY